MNEMIFEPYAVHLDFQMDAPIEADDWRLILSELLETYASQCSKAGPCVIGHIKGFAHGNDDTFLKVSVVSPNHPADIDGNMKGGISELSLVLNVLVYGQPKETLAQHLLELVNIPGKIWTGHVAVVPAVHEHDHIKNEVEG